MIGSSGRRRAARGHLARLVAVLAVLAGLVLLHSPHCTDGMTAMPHLATSAGSGTATAAISCGSSATMTEAGSQPATMAHQLAAVCPAVAGVVAAGSSHGSDGMGGLLATCLAFIVAVLATLLGLRPSWQQVALIARLSERVTRIRAVVPRAPSLAELCLLRT